jgi:hypothetical protein
MQDACPDECDTRFFVILAQSPVDRLAEPLGDIDDREQDTESNRDPSKSEVHE